jgi:hypothetical protein
MKAPVYLRDTSGKLLIPPTALTLDPANSVPDRIVDSFTVNDDRTNMVLSTSKGPVAVRLLDHVTIKINVLDSRSHLPPVKLELVSMFGTVIVILGSIFIDADADVNFRGAGPDAQPSEGPVGTPAGNSTSGQQSNTSRIDIKAELIKAKRAANAPKALVRTEYSQTLDTQSFYVLAEQMQHLSIEDVKLVKKVPPVTSLKNFKGRKAFKFVSFFRQHRHAFPHIFSPIISNNTERMN